jgi:NAD(P)-dependent dehydrogenase (short-subunit alcohol dehydrogenase family)
VLETKHIVITGGSRGIGLSLAQRFLELDCRVTIAGRSESTTRAAVEQLSKNAPAHASSLEGIACDVSQAAQLEQLWQRASARAPVDVWINNAGAAAKLAPLWEQSAQALEDVIDTNVRGVLLGSWVALRGMRERGSGVIYNLEGFGADGSMYPGVLSYGASKRAVAYITKALAAEAKATGVRVCSIDPGAVHTDMVRATWGEVSAANKLMATMIDALAIEPGECAKLLAPRLLDNARTGVRIRPWNDLVAWLRVLTLPLLALLRGAPRSSTDSPS